MVRSVLNSMDIKKKSKLKQFCKSKSSDCSIRSSKEKLYVSCGNVSENLRLSTTTQFHNECNEQFYI